MGLSFYESTYWLKTAISGHNWWQFKAYCHLLALTPGISIIFCTTKEQLIAAAGEAVHALVSGMPVLGPWIEFLPKMGDTHFTIWSLDQWHSMFSRLAMQTSGDPAWLQKPLLSWWLNTHHPQMPRVASLEHFGQGQIGHKTTWFSNWLAIHNQMMPGFHWNHVVYR